MLAQLIGRVSDNHPDCIGIDWLVFDNSFVVAAGSFFSLLRKKLVDGQ